MQLKVEKFKRNISILFKRGLYLLFWQLQQENDYYYKICIILANIPKLSLLVNNSQQWPRAFYLRCALCLTHYRVSWFSYMISKSETKKTSAKVTFNIQKSFLCQSICVVNKCSTCYFTKELVSNQAFFCIIETCKQTINIFACTEQSLTVLAL